MTAILTKFEYLYNKSNWHIVITTLYYELVGFAASCASVVSPSSYFHDRATGADWLPFRSVANHGPALDFHLLNYNCSR